MLKTFIATDGNADVEIVAKDEYEAAQEYVDGGDWGEITSTEWFGIFVKEITDGGDIIDHGCIQAVLQPEEPDCTEQEHCWESPYELLGGCKSNPGVWGKGGGVIITEVCAHCGLFKKTDTWAQNRETGEQGLTSTTYRDPTQESLEWAISE